MTMCWPSKATTTPACTFPSVVNDTTGSPLVAVGVTAGSQQTYALIGDSTGSVRGWGSDTFGQLGTGASVATPNPAPLTVAGLTGIAQIASKGDFAIALRADGTVLGIGRNDKGQLGNGSTSASGTGISSPSTIATFTTPTATSAGRPATFISAGIDHAVAVDGTGAVWAWGNNNAGQLGAATPSLSNLPVQVTALPGKAVTVEAGYQDTLAVLTTNAVYGWGADTQGQLGDGTSGASNNKKTPTLSQFAPGHLAAYGYDGDGLRTSRTVSGQKNQFVYDRSAGLPLVVGYGSGTSYTYYLTGPGGIPIEQIGPSNLTAWFQTDNLGSIRQATGTGTGANVVGTATYTPYGVLKTGATCTLTAGCSFTNTFNFGYAGQWTDSETGFQYLRARYYDPATAQFLTRDPMSSITREPYGYVGNNPLNGTDPLGLFCVGSLCTDGITDALDDAWDGSYEWGVDHLDEVSTVANGISMVAYASCGITGGTGCGVGAFFNGVSAGAQGLHTAMNCARSRDATCASSAVSSAISLGGVFAPPLLAGRLVPAFRPNVATAFSNYLYDLFVWMPSLGWNTPDTYEC